jgi:aminotransferase
LKEPRLISAFVSLKRAFSSYFRFLPAIFSDKMSIRSVSSCTLDKWLFLAIICAIGSFNEAVSHGWTLSLSFNPLSPRLLRLDTLLYTGSAFKISGVVERVCACFKHKHFILNITSCNEDYALLASFQPAERLKRIKPSGIRRFFALSREMPDTINLSVGEPDCCPSPHALRAGWRAAREGKTHYSATNGIPDLREALAEKAQREYGLTYDSDSEVLISVGGTEAIFVALMSLLNSGDEVLIPDPGFVAYEPGVLLSDGVPIKIPLLEQNGFKPSVEDVTSLITNRSRVIIMNYPNNPTGAILSLEEASALAEIAVDRDLVVISDEVYERIIYDDRKHICLASLPRMRDRTLTVNSFSKSYAMTGLRVGYIYGPEKLIAPLWLVHQYAVACVNGLSQYAALAALKGPQDSVHAMTEEFKRRRDLVYHRLNEIRGFRCTLPLGAFYVFPNITGFGMSSEKFCEFLAEEAGVLTVPGTAFGTNGEGHIRISYAASYAQLEEGLDRIEKAVKKIR